MGVVGIDENGGPKAGEGVSEADITPATQKAAIGSGIAEARFSCERLFEQIGRAFEVESQQDADRWERSRLGKRKQSTRESFCKAEISNSYSDNFGHQLEIVCLMKFE